MSEDYGLTEQQLTRFSICGTVITITLVVGSILHLIGADFKVMAWLMFFGMVLPGGYIMNMIVSSMRPRALGLLMQFFVWIIVIGGFIAVLSATISEG